MCRIDNGKRNTWIISRLEKEYQQHMNVNKHLSKRVMYFKYLGRLLTQDNRPKMEESEKCYFGLGNILSSRLISINLKIQMYTMSLIRIIYFRDMSTKKNGGIKIKYI